MHQRNRGKEWRLQSAIIMFRRPIWWVHRMVASKRDLMELTDPRLTCRINWGKIKRHSRPHPHLLISSRMEAITIHLPNSIQEPERSYKMLSVESDLQVPQETPVAVPNSNRLMCQIWTKPNSISTRNRIRCKITPTVDKAQAIPFSRSTLISLFRFLGYKLQDKQASSSKQPQVTKTTYSPKILSLTLGLLKLTIVRKRVTLLWQTTISVLSVVSHLPTSAFLTNEPSTPKLATIKFRLPRTNLPTKTQWILLRKLTHPLLAKLDLQKVKGPSLAPTTPKLWRLPPYTKHRVQVLLMASVRKWPKAS